MTLLLSTGGSDGALWRWDEPGDPRRIADAADASFVMRLPDGRLLALCGGEEGIFRLFAADGDGFEEVSSGPSGGGEPCYAALDPAGTHVIIVNYGPPSVSVWPIGADVDSVATASLPPSGSGVVADRQESSHPHSAVFISSHELLVADLGADALLLCTWHDGVVTFERAIPTPPGSGPRHIAVTENLVAVTAELSNEAMTLELAALRSATAESWHRATATVHGSAAAAGGEDVSYPGDIAIDHSGDVLVANRGADTIARFRAEEEGLRLVDELPAGGRWPQRILVDRDDLVVAARDSSCLVRGGKSAAALTTPTWIARW